MIKICLTCYEDIPKLSKQWNNQKYCSTRCRKVAFSRKKARHTRIEQRKANLIQNDEALYLIGQCRRAGTVQILSGHTLTSFTKTMSLIKNREKGGVERCHIAPVNGVNSIGLLHYKNLFYGGIHQNRLFGNNYYSGGLSINRENLRKKWRVSSQMSNNDVLVMIEKFLGGIVERYIENNSVLKSKKIRIIDKILMADPSESKEHLINKSCKYLNDLFYRLSRGDSFLRHHGVESKYLAYLNEISRFRSYGGKRKPLLTKLRRIMIIGYMALERVAASETYNKYFYVEYEPLINPKYAQAMLIQPGTWMVFKDLIYNAAFTVLQGGDLDIRQFRKQIMSYLTFPKKAWKETGLQYYRANPAQPELHA